MGAGDKAVGGTLLLLTSAAKQWGSAGPARRTGWSFWVLNLVGLPTGDGEGQVRHICWDGPTRNEDA